MKKCSKCGDKKEISYYHKNIDKKDGLQNKCKSCCKKRDQKSYQKRKTSVIKYQKWRYGENRIWLNEYKKSCKCTKCKEDRWYILDFHHKDPTMKEGDISNLIKSSIKKVLEELQKCIPLCKNCHSEFHYLEKTKNINIEEYLLM